jgi:hypothetical protein
MQGPYCINQQRELLRILKFQLYVPYAAGAEATECCKCETDSEPPTKLVTLLEIVRRLSFVSWSYKEDRGVQTFQYILGGGEWLMPAPFYCITSPKQRKFIGGAVFGKLTLAACG